MRIVGITGTVGAGKGTVVEYMVKNMGFKHFSATAFLGKELDRLGQEHNRDNLRILADGLRKEHGSSYVIDQLYKEAINYGQDAIIESIRCIGEIEKLRTYPDFFLLGIDADRKKRYERVVLRGSAKDNITYEQFIEQENKEIHTTNPYEMNLVGCLQLADVVIKNNDDVTQLYFELERAMGE